MALFSRDILGNVGKVFDAHGPLAAVVGGDLRGHPERARWVFARGPELLREIMAVEALHKPPLTKRIGRRPGVHSERIAALQRWGGGLFGANGAEHKLQRRLLMPAFHKSRIESYRDGMVAIIDEELAGWRPGTVRDLLADMRFLTLRIAARTLLGEEILERGEGSTGERIQRALHLLVRPSVFLLPYDAPGFPFRRLLDVVCGMEAGIRRLIAARRTAGTDGGDVLSMLIQAREEGGGVLTEEQVIEHISVMFIAGHETSSNALSWMALLLCLHPRIAADLLDELTAVLGGAPPSVEQLGALPLLDAVVKEGLRLMPPAPLNARFAAADTTVAGHDIPAGTNVLMSIYHTHRLPELFPRPALFDPCRWATIKPALHDYMPFGVGPRTCIGGPFATMEIKLVMAMLLCRFRLEWIPATRVDRFTAITLGIRGRLPMRVRAQDRAFAPARDVRGQVREMVDLPE